MPSNVADKIFFAFVKKEVERVCDNNDDKDKKNHTPQKAGSFKEGFSFCFSVTSEQMERDGAARAG